MIKIVDVHHLKSSLKHQHLVKASNINPERHLNASSLHLNNAGISVLVRDFQAFLKNLDWQEYEDV